MGMSRLEVDLKDIETYEESYALLTNALKRKTMTTTDIGQHGSATRISDGGINLAFQMIEQYIKGSQWARLPDYEAADFPFHKQFLYWHRLQ